MAVTVSLTRRILSGTVLGILAIFFVFLSPYSLLAAVAVLGVLALSEFHNLQKGITHNRIGFVFLGVCFIVIPLLFAVLIRWKTHGDWRLFLVIVATAMCDTFAYFIGKVIGKYKLAPRISPGKTVEGTIGGILFCIATIVALGGRAGIPVEHRFILGLILGFGAVLGDLFESYLKRIAGVKDSGDILPGHGGILDRIDSHLATLVLAYFYYSFIL